LLIWFSSFLELALCCQQGQFPCQPFGHDADGDERIDKFLILSAVPGSFLGLKHPFHLRSEGWLCAAFKTHWKKKPPLDEEPDKLLKKSPTAFLGQPETVRI
jgi:hypothetical protein